MTSGKLLAPYNLYSPLPTPLLPIVPADQCNGLSRESTYVFLLDGGVQKAIQPGEQHLAARLACAG